MEHGQHIINHLHKAGLYWRQGMAPAPLPHGEIESWARLSCIDLSPWEAEMIQFLSEQYVGSLSSSASLAAPPPWSPSENIDRSAVASGIDRIFGTINKAIKKGGK